jgi:hypothetical protein
MLGEFRPSDGQTRSYPHEKGLVRIAETIISARISVLRIILRSVRAPFEAARRHHFSAPAMRNLQLHQAR